MDYEVGMHEQQQHDAAQKAVMEMTQANAMRQSVQESSAEARSALNAASTSAGRQMENLTRDVRDTGSRELGQAAEAWQNDARDALDAADASASAFFNQIDARVEASDDRARQALSDLAEQAAEVVRDFAVQVEQQSCDLAEAVANGCEENKTEELDETFREAAEQTAALQDDLNARLQQCEEQLRSMQLDGERTTHLHDVEQSEQAVVDQIDREAIVAEAMDRLDQGQYQSGELIELQPHRAAEKARDEMDVSGQTHQSAHAGPQKALEPLDDYSAKNMLTRIMERDRHSDMDAGWKREFRSRADQGEVDLTVQDLYDTVARSIDAATQLSDREKESHKAHLSDELFTQLGLDREQRVRMPYSRS
jgi:hypothetical protein